MSSDQQTNMPLLYVSCFMSLALRDHLQSMRVTLEPQLCQDVWLWGFELSRPDSSKPQATRVTQDDQNCKGTKDHLYTTHVGIRSRGARMTVGNWQAYEDCTQEDCTSSKAVSDVEP